MPHCYPCTRYFSSEHGLDQHLRYSSAHADEDFDMYECETCNHDFPTARSANQHMDALQHWAICYECDTCTSTFLSQPAVENHMYSEGHWKHYCHECQRKFDSANNLQMHLNSRLHRGASIACPFCQRSFVTASGVSHHLESGSCPRAVDTNRIAIHRAIQSRDPNGAITTRSLEWNGNFEVTGGSWNGYGYECYLCGNVYTTLPGLNTHVNSGPHRQSIYHCPNGRCSTEFVSLGALFNHLESESCGFIRFERVRNTVSGFLDGSSRLITFN